MTSPDGSGFERIESSDEPFWRSLLGRKVSVRYRDHGDPLHPFSEAIGVVAAVRTGESGPVADILTRKGDVREVRLEDLIAGKAWPK